MGSYDGKSVIVTGGAKGIGKGICLAFANEGAKVICADVDDAAGAALLDEVKDLEGEIRFESTDVALAQVCSDLVDTAKASFGSLDVICNNVGIQPTSSYLPAHELPEEAWDRIIDVNLKSVFLMTKYGAPVMMEQGGGVIINTASVQGLQSMLSVSAYAASKGGILSLTRQLALEYAPHGIRVLAVNPGTIDTPLVDDAIDFYGLDPVGIREKWAGDHPIGRIGQPDEIAQAVLFLASDRASFMTGSYVNVDGGLMAKGAWA